MIFILKRNTARVPPSRQVYRLSIGKAGSTLKKIPVATSGPLVAVSNQLSAVNFQWSAIRSAGG
jgi:hypothetical protein